MFKAETLQLTSTVKFLIWREQLEGSRDLKLPRKGKNLQQLTSPRSPRAPVTKHPVHATIISLTLCDISDNAGRIMTGRD